jgi:phosphate transport system permease protein
MATDTSTGDIESFGTVNKTVGTAFQYLLLAATLFGLVVLGALLVYVANDAIQPLTADPGWHLTFLLTLVAPTLGVTAFLYRRDADALRFGATSVGMTVVTLMFAGGVGMIFVDILSPFIFLSYLFALALPFALVLALQRRARQIPFFTRAGATTLAFYLSLFGFPGPVGAVAGVPAVVPGLPALIQSVPTIPLPWMSLTATLGLGIAAIVGVYGARIRDRRAGLITGGGALGAIGASGALGPVAGVTSVPAVVLASVAVVPTAAYAAGTAVSRPDRRIGLLVPAVVIGGALVGEVAVGALGIAGPQSWVDWQFLTSAHSRTAVNAGLYPAIGGSILLMVTVAVLSFPLGVGAAVYLEEYAPDNRFTRFIDVNISNLAGVPSVVYGLLGLGVFVTYLGQPTGTVLIGGATLALLILPIVIISSREAIRSVPTEMRQASYGMGATKWQTVRRVVLPRAFPGILTGTILALGRAIGETAPLIMIGAPSVLFSLPTGVTSKVSAMPLQVFAWSSLFASEDFYTKAVPAGVVVLVGVLLAMNSIAIVLRNKYQSDQ